MLIALLALCGGVFLGNLSPQLRFQENRAQEAFETEDQITSLNSSSFVGSKCGSRSCRQLFVQPDARLFIGIFEQTTPKCNALAPTCSELITGLFKHSLGI